MEFVSKFRNFSHAYREQYSTAAFVFLQTLICSVVEAGLCVLLTSPSSQDDEDDERAARKRRKARKKRMREMERA